MAKTEKLEKTEPRLVDAAMPNAAPPNAAPLNAARANAESKASTVVAAAVPQHTVAKSAPKTETKIASKTESKLSTKIESKTESKTEMKTDSNRDSKSVAKSSVAAAKPSAKGTATKTAINRFDSPQGKLLRSLFDATVAAALPANCLAAHLPERPSDKSGGRVIIVGCGKAAAAMAAAVEAAWQAKYGKAALKDGKFSGIVVTRKGQVVPTQVIEVLEASHPVQDEMSEIAAKRILESVRGLKESDLVIALISGGGSALMSMPIQGLPFVLKQQINRRLLKSGATITEMNIVRKHLSAIKGGRLAAAAAPARVVSLLMSDVPGDDPSVIASGPTVGDPSTAADTLEILKRYQIDLPDRIKQSLITGDAETPKPNLPIFRNSKDNLRMIVTPQMALEAAATVARKSAYKPMILGSAIEGEAREVAIMHAGIARQVQEFNQPIAAPALLLSGGETTVTVRGNGRGGRNLEFLLALLIALDGRAGVWAVAADTDGIDGTEDNAGAIITPDSLARAAQLGLMPRDYLARNDGYGFFSRLGDLLVTGPTMTNVNDFRAMLIEG